MKLPEVLTKIGVPRYLHLSDEERVAFVETIREGRVAPPPKIRKGKRKKKETSDEARQISLPRA